MGKRDDVVRERVDAVDEIILLTLKEGAQRFKNLHILSGINYNTFRQRLNKLIRYNLLGKPKYGEYALSEKGRHFIDELTSPVVHDLKDPKLKKLIDMLPTELHRMFFRSVLSGVIAKHCLADTYDDGYPSFLLGGKTKSFKTALATIVCKVLGLKPEENIYPLFSGIAGEFGVRRFRAKGEGFHINASPFFKQTFVCLDEYDKVIDRDTQRNVLFFLDGRRKFPVEGETIENRTCTMVTLNTKIGEGSITRFGIPAPYIRRSIVADTEHVHMELRDVDLVAKRIFEMKDFPKIDLGKLCINHTELPEDLFNCLRNLLMNCTDEAFLGLIDTKPLVILVLGRSALLGGDVREAMYQTLWDRLGCLESLGGVVARWREKVLKEWMKYKREGQPEIEKQLMETEQREKGRVRMLNERAAAIQKKKVEQINAQTAFIFHRAELSLQIQGLIKELGQKEALAEPLRWLRKKIDSSRTPEDLSQYENSFNKTTLPKVELRLQEKKNAKEQVKREKETAKWLAETTKEIERKAEIRKKEQKQKEREQKKDEILKLRACLEQINYYLGRKELKEGEDPVLILQELKIIQPVEGSRFLKASNKPVKGYWLWHRRMGLPYYNPPVHDFIDSGATIQWWSNEVINGKLYTWLREVRYWTSWENIWPLLQAKRTKILSEIAALTGSKDMEKG